MLSGTPLCSITAETAANSPQWSAILRSTMGQQFLKQRTELDDVGKTIVQDFGALFGAKGSTLKDALAHCILIFFADRIEAEMAECSYQALTRCRRVASVDVAPEHRRQVDDVLR